MEIKQDLNGSLSYVIQTAFRKSSLLDSIENADVKSLYLYEVNWSKIYINPLPAYPGCR